MKISKATQAKITELRRLAALPPPEPADRFIQRIMAAFCEGLKPERFDTLSTIVPDFDSLAQKYNTTSRSVRRWHALGVEVNDPAQVALYLASIQHPAPESFAAVETLLENELATLTP